MLLDVFPVEGSLPALGILFPMIKTYLFTKDEIQEDVPLDDWRALVKVDCALLWVDARQFTDEELDSLKDRFDLHSVALELCKGPYHRPHLHEFEDHFYVNLIVLKEQDSDSSVTASNLHVLVGDRFIITLLSEDGADVVDSALEEYKDTPGLCSRGSAHAVYLLAEGLTETYLPIVERLDSDADSLEEAMFQTADTESLRKLFLLKHRGFDLRRLLGAQRDVLNQLARREFPFLQGTHQIYFQDVYNRMIRLFDMLDTVREILNGVMDIYLTSVSNRLNEILKVLTAAIVILGTVTFVCAFFGMNFYLTWFFSPNGFRNVSIALGGIAVVMLALFRWKKWI